MLGFASIILGLWGCLLTALFLVAVTDGQSIVCHIKHIFDNPQTMLWETMISIQVGIWSALAMPMAQRLKQLLVAFIF
jgi:peptidoglycan/LPS O-acetylase OafA/YrhL